MSGGSLPSARHTIQFVDCLYVSLLGYHPSAMSIRGYLLRSNLPVCTYWYVHMRFRYMDVLCTTAVSCSTIVICIRYVLRSTVLNRILRGGALSKYHTWNDITATPTRRTRLAQRDKQCFDGCVPAPLYPYTYHEAPLIRCE